MIHKLREVVISNVEPEDRHVIWLYDGTLLYYRNGIWVPLIGEAFEISKFELQEAGLYEKGAIVDTLHFSWEYSKDAVEIREQSLAGVPLDIMQREAVVEAKVKEDTSWTLTVSDGTTEVSKTVSITFQDFLYGCVGTSTDKMVRITSSRATFVAGEGQYIYLFVPSSLSGKMCLFEDYNCLDDFVGKECTHVNNVGRVVEGVMYTSKNAGLGTVNLKFV